MQSLLSTSCPLRSTSVKNLESLCQALWSWKPCSCRDDPISRCSSQLCDWSRFQRLTAFFGYYKAVTASYVPSRLRSKDAAISSHENLHEIIRALKQQTDQSKRALVRTLLPSWSTNQTAEALIDRDRALNLAVRVMFMVDCGSSTKSVGDIEFASQTLVWEHHESLKEFLERAFPSPRTSEWPEAARVLSAIPARRLVRVGGLRLLPTSNMYDHLRIDEDCVLVFDCIPFLQECMQKDDVDCLMPKSLLRETIATVQQVLLPLDAASQFVLRSLFTKSSFDAMTKNRIAIDTKANFAYFRSRLIDLYDEVQHPKPRGVLEKWFERRSGARHVMMATFIGVIFAVILGMLSLAVSIFQAWVAYQQWKHPIETSSNA